jgi:hypothetical protein
MFCAVFGHMDHWFIVAKYVCMLFISTVDQPIERVTIQVLDCLVTGSCTCK